MAVYMVERDLPGVTMDQLAAAQKAAIETGQQFTDRAKTCATFVPRSCRVKHTACACSKPITLIWFAR